MKEFLFFVSNFLDFWFLPFVIGLIVSIIIEQILRATGNEYDPTAVKKVETASRVRKFLWRQNLILNFSWFVCYFLLMIMLRSTPNAPMPDMIWQG
jgi:preprotein translocase subunit SecG|tara:strand:- start:218 stop:505 length:288 start_codon:yes stop_codon:yes gene_type:complete